MRILFFTSQGQDNLEDAYLHGLRALFGAECVDYPKKDVLYKGFSARPPDECYGRLFTLWRTLDDLPIDRLDIEKRIKSDYFDYIIFGSIHRAQPFFQYYEPFLRKEKTILLDGEDDPGVVVGARKFLCFKREIQSWGAYYYYRHGQRIRTWRYGRRAGLRNLLPIAFAIPKEKITEGITRTRKTRIFPALIVDEELSRDSRLGSVARQIEPSGTENMNGNGQSVAQLRGYTVNDENEYYRDLQQARFGITMKRGGWDSLRHYEIAANGAVICFRQLECKPEQCGPYGLNSTNCISYSSNDELFERIEDLSDDTYDLLQAGTYEWIRKQTTEVQARMLLARAGVQLQK